MEFNVQNVTVFCVFLHMLHRKNEGPVRTMLEYILLIGTIIPL